MSRLILVRHGQASFMADDYDQLSPLGVRQSAELGAYYGGLDKPIHRVLVGPRRRHQQTFTAFARAYEATGQRLPTPSAFANFDEHAGVEVGQVLIPQFAKSDPQIAKWHNEGNPTPGDQLRIIRHVLEQWATGQVTVDGVESWDAFCKRIEAGIAEIMATAQRKETVIAFTSGGTISAVVGQALELTAAKIIGLNWVTHNTGLSEFAFNATQFSLITFNAIPHLQDDAMQSKM